MVAQLATKADFTKALADAGEKLVAQHGQTPRPGRGRAGHLLRAHAGLPVSPGSVAGLRLPWPGRAAPGSLGCAAARAELPTVACPGGGRLHRDVVRPVPAHRTALRAAGRGEPRRRLRQGGRRRELGGLPGVCRPPDPTPNLNPKPNPNSEVSQACAAPAPTPSLSSQDPAPDLTRRPGSRPCRRSTS